MAPSLIDPGNDPAAEPPGEFLSEGTNAINIAFSRCDDSKVRDEYRELFSRRSTSNT